MPGSGGRAAPHRLGGAQVRWWREGDDGVTPRWPGTYQGPPDRRVKVFKTWAAANPAEAAAFNTAMTTWRAQRDEAWKKYAGLM